MEIRLLTSLEDYRRYGDWVRSHPEGSLWQSLEWKMYQESLGREVKIYAAMEDSQIHVSALVVIDRTRFGWSTWEIPRAPLAVAGFELRVSSVLEKIAMDALKNGALSILFSPPTHIPQLACPEQGRRATRNSQRFVMPEATRIIDLTLSEEDLLGQMKPKGRYNIRLSQKHGVHVVTSHDVQAFARLADETARRDGFRGHSQGFYERFLNHLPGAFLLFAVTPSSSPAGERIEGAGLLGAIWGPPTPVGSASGLRRAGSTGIYYYGASSRMQKELMTPYLLQWEAMKYCRAQGCSSYDLFGIAPEGQPNHPWSGVSDFKAKFGGRVVTYPPEQEIVLRPGMQMLLRMKRKFIG